MNWPPRRPVIDLLMCWRTSPIPISTLMSGLIAIVDLRRGRRRGQEEVLTAKVRATLRARPLTEWFVPLSDLAWLRSNFL